MQSLRFLDILAAHQHSSTFQLGVSFSIQPIIALVCGLIILVCPRFLNFVVALYLILIGVLGLFHLRF